MRRLLLICLPTIFTTLSWAEDLDSLRWAIQGMTFAVPRLSPLPEAIAGGSPATLTLAGTWQFDPTGQDSTQMRDIQVPGEWELQGFHVQRGTRARYRRQFTLPAGWTGHRVKIRFDGVSSSAIVSVNGVPVGSHEGGFVPFEFDISGALVRNANTLEVGVQCETISDLLACTSQYAAHPVGGIVRKVVLFAVPPVSIAELVATPGFDAGFSHARVLVRARIAVEGSVSGNTVLQTMLLDSAGQQIAVTTTNMRTLDTDVRSVTLRCSLDVPAPRLWDPEHPHLYTLAATLRIDNAAIYTVSQHIGLRAIELRGNRLLVNGLPVKLRGVNRHEVHPLSGRSLTPELCRRDVELFRAGNCNFIRSSHYPPSDEFLAACDELGMFVESEAALCWIGHPAAPVWNTMSYLDTVLLPTMVRAGMENVLAGRSHPSIILWSLGNESRWGPLWERVNKEVKLLDPTRPTVFHDQCRGGFNNAGSRADIANYHYPGFNGPRECENDTLRPTLFGEFMHVQTYARREVLADPGVRGDSYAASLRRMVDSVYRYPACLGGAIWSGIDDIFHLSDRRICGYGPWGVIDGWRRTKPEYTGMKHSYAPVILVAPSHPSVHDGVLELEVENRYNFTNLREATITVQVGDRINRVTADILPLHRGILHIDMRQQVNSHEVLLTVIDPRGFECVRERIMLTEDQSLPAHQTHAKVLFTNDGHTILVSTGTTATAINASTGIIESISIAGHSLVNRGGEMIVIPFNNDDGGAPGISSNNYTQDLTPLAYAPLSWFVASSVVALPLKNGDLNVTVAGAFPKRLKGSQSYLFSSDGSITIRYDYVALKDFMRKDTSALRQSGMLFTLPKEFDVLRWKRKGLWSTYPPDDPNRLEGTASASPLALPFVELPRIVPSGLWKDDGNSMGTADFRGTKGNVLQAVLQNSSGGSMEVRSDGSQSTRTWMEKDCVRLLVAGMNEPGSCIFFTGPRTDVARGSHLRGEFLLSGHTTAHQNN